MKAPLFSKIIRAAVCCLAVTGGVSQAGQGLVATRVGSRIDVTIDGRFFTSYRFSAEEKYPFFFPVNGPSNASVTSMRNGNYPHHSSLFFGCDLVNGGNYWQEGLTRGQIVSEGPVLESGSSGKEIVITDVCNWKRPDAPQPFRDTRRIVISSPSDSLRQIDFNVTLEALEEVEIKKTNHSLFSARMDSDITPAFSGTMVNAGGDCGEKATFGKPSPWLACFGPRGAKTVEGLVILQHPGNPGFPSPWFTRDYGFLSPTPMFWPADGKSTHFKKGEKLQLRYRVLVFSGTPEQAGIAQRFTEFSGGISQPAANPAAESNAGKYPFRLITLDPGHFHASLVQSRMLPGVSPVVHVYAPEGPDLAMHLDRIQRFNTRKDDPTSWDLKVHAGADFRAKLFAEKPGNIVVLSGNNRDKARNILDSVKAGFHVLSDKPMAITPADFKLLQEAYAVAAQKKLILSDIMTERFEITTQLQRFFAHQPEFFGTIDPGSPGDPSVTKVSVHHFYKSVSGVPLQRPPWFYDVTQQGEAIVDVTTHLVDLVQWEVFPERTLPLDAAKVLNARVWKTKVTPAQFTRSTKVQEFPAYLRPYVDARGDLDIPSNGEFTFLLDGVHAKVSVTWAFEAPAGGGDTHYSLIRGTKASAIIRQGAEQNFKPVLFLEPREGVAPASLETALASIVAEAGKQWPGVGIEKSGKGWTVTVPAKYHVGHEAHFGQVAERFLGFVKSGTMPAWEVPNTLAKYRTIMDAYSLSRKKVTQASSL